MSRIFTCFWLLSLVFCASINGANFSISAQHIAVVSQIGKVFTAKYHGGSDSRDTRVEAFEQVPGGLDDVVITSVFIQNEEFNSSVYSLYMLDVDGNVWAYGANRDGQLGLGHSVKIERPERVLALEGKNIIAIAATGSFSAFLTNDGFVWGCGRWGRSDPLPTPTLMPNLENIVAMSASVDSLTFLTISGNVFALGDINKCFVPQVAQCNYFVGSHGEDVLREIVEVNGIATRIACGGYGFAFINEHKHVQKVEKWFNGDSCTAFTLKVETILEGESIIDLAGAFPNFAMLDSSGMV